MLPRLKHICKKFASIKVLPNIIHFYGTCRFCNMFTCTAGYIERTRPTKHYKHHQEEFCDSCFSSQNPQSVLIAGTDKLDASQFKTFPTEEQRICQKGRGFTKKGEDLQKRERIYTKREDFRQQKGRRFATTKKGEDMPAKKILSQLNLCGLTIKLNMNKSLSGEIKSYL